jgi:hypothetical protein
VAVDDVRESRTRGQFNAGDGATDPVTAIRGSARSCHGGQIVRRKNGRAMKEMETSTAIRVRPCQNGGCCERSR